MTKATEQKIIDMNLRMNRQISDMKIKVDNSLRIEIRIDDVNQKSSKTAIILEKNNNDKIITNLLLQNTHVRTITNKNTNDKIIENINNNATGYNKKLDGEFIDIKVSKIKRKKDILAIPNSIIDATKKLYPKKKYILKVSGNERQYIVKKINEEWDIVEDININSLHEDIMKAKYRKYFNRTIIREKFKGIFKDIDNGILKNTHYRLDESEFIPFYIYVDDNNKSLGSFYFEIIKVSNVSLDELSLNNQNTNVNRTNTMLLSNYSFNMSKIEDEFIRIFSNERYEYQTNYEQLEIKKRNQKLYNQTHQKKIKTIKMEYYNKAKINTNEDLVNYKYNKPVEIKSKSTLNTNSTKYYLFIKHYIHNNFTFSSNDRVLKNSNILSKLEYIKWMNNKS